MNLNHRVIVVTFIPETNEKPSRFKLSEQRMNKRDNIVLNWNSNTDLSNTLLQAVHYLESIGINVVGYGSYGSNYLIFSNTWANAQGFKNILNKIEE